MFNLLCRPYPYSGHWVDQVLIVHPSWADKTLNTELNKDFVSNHSIPLKIGCAENFLFVFLYTISLWIPWTQQHNPCNGYSSTSLKSDAFCLEQCTFLLWGCCWSGHFLLITLYFMFVICYLLLANSPSINCTVCTTYFLPLLLPCICFTYHLTHKLTYSNMTTTYCLLLPSCYANMQLASASYF